MRLARVALVCATLSTATLAGQTTTKVIPAPEDVATPPADAVTTASGLRSRVLTPGTGTEKPAPTDLVTVQYTGWSAEGRMFDSTYARGKPSTFPLDRVIPGWREGVQLMVAGEKRRFWVPEALAYAGKREPRGTVTFDVELLSFTPSPTIPPADVKAPPSDAKRTPSGLAYKVLTPGTGTRRPPARGDVTVHYSGWTSAGRLFDSSVTRGQPTTFSLTDVIDGWTEGLQLMVEGEKTRFWIPERLAYKGERAPYGALTFDVELIRIE